MNAAASRYNHYYENDGLNSDEEEEERRLSEQHGEAADDDAPSSKRKRGSNHQQNTILTEEDAAAAKEFEEKVRRKKARPALTPAEIKGEKGLVFVRRSFPTSVRRFRDVPLAGKARGTGARSSELARRLNANSQINAAAQYSRSLMGAYREFALELFPSLAVEDVFLKIEDLGSKKEVKDYLQIMREEFRKEYLEGIYGGEKANRILSELQYGLRASHPLKEKLEGKLGRSAVAPRIGRAVIWEEENSDEGGMEIAHLALSPKRTAVANPYARKARKNDDEAPKGVGREQEAVEKDNDATLDDPTAKAVAEKSPGSAEEDEEEEATFSVSGDDGAADNAASGLAKDESIGVPKDESVGLAAVEAEENNDGTLVDPGSDKHDDVIQMANESITDELTQPTAEKQDNVVQEADESNANEPTESVSEKKDDVFEKAVKRDPAVAYVEKEANEYESPRELQQTRHAASLDKEEAISGEIIGEVIDEGVGDQKNYSSTQEAVDDKTQETLTLMESQFDDIAMEFTQDERSSQAEAGKWSESQGEAHNADSFSQTQEERFSQTQDERVSQTQDERFSQAQDDAGANETQVDGFIEEESNADERFSQFTQQSCVGPIFEEDGCGVDDVSNDIGGNWNRSDQLGQTMNTQLSMEY